MPAAVSPPPGPVVGFDLDLTLVDSAGGIAATLQACGVPTTAAEVVPHVGLPLEQVIAARLAALSRPAEPRVVAALVEDYRARYPQTGIPGTRPLPGAASALEAVRALVGRVAVVSAKAPHLLEAMLVEVGLDDAVDVTGGGLFAEAKGRLLAELGAHVYVGDHPGDVVAAHTCGALAVGVATGPCTLAQLREAGADVALADLTGFGVWLGDWWARRNETGGLHR
ncbi:MAG: HAD family hydrolase [Kineosporiaceae bacterium]